MATEQRVASNQNATSTISEVLEKYQSFEQKINDMLVMQSKGQSIDEQLRTLLALRDEILVIQTKSPSSAKAETDGKQNDGIPFAGPNKNLEIQNQTKFLIQNLLQKVAKLEASARESYQTLIPEIDQTVRSKQMRMAYRDA